MRTALYFSGLVIAAASLASASPVAGQGHTVRLRAVVRFHPRGSKIPGSRISSLSDEGLSANATGFSPVKSPANGNFLETRNQTLWLRLWRLQAAEKPRSAGKWKETGSSYLRTREGRHRSTMATPQMYDRAQCLIPKTIQCEFRRFNSIGATYSLLTCNIGATNGV
ncbi:hypothetical protein C8J56DRAFT_922132 [Mycena floridula]|nr:hypothetical protein C8J56DRAFT_922132 [Mycena floridula]